MSTKPTKPAARDKISCATFIIVAEMLVMAIL
jgi:hypothetical protein